MKVAKMLVLTALLALCASTVQAGEIHPNLQLMLDQAGPDDLLGVIVHMQDQALVDQISADLTAAGVTRKVRHREIVVSLKDAATAQDPFLAYLDARIASGDVIGYTSHWITSCVVVQAKKTEILQIAARGDIDIVEPNFTVSLIEPVSRGSASYQDPDAEVSEDGDRGIGITPGLLAIGARDVWEQFGFRGEGVLIGSCDTGVDGTHPALTDRWRGNFHPHSECWLDVLNNGSTTPVDYNNHGTHTTGTMTGLAYDDTIGVAPGAQWIATNVIDQGVSSDFDNDVIVCYEWFADPDGDPFTDDDVPDVIQNSWRVNEGFPGGYTDCDSRWWAAIDNCEAAGVATFWSAGNEGPGGHSIGSPPDRATTLTNCFSIGAVDATSYGWPYPIANFSSRGPSGCPGVPPENLIKPEVVAPGVDVYSSVPGGGYAGGWNGTSMSGPHVTGVAALMRQANPDLDVNSIKMILMETARDEGTPGEDNVYGWGFIDAVAAVERAMTGFGGLEGHVLNASFGDIPIVGAEVRLLDSSYRFNTGPDGYYSGMAAPGIYTAEASAPGFAPQTFTVEIVAEETAVQDFALTDIAGPQITGVSEPVATSDTAGPYVIMADIHDASTVALAILYYRANGGAWQQTAMTETRAGYEGDIPGYPANTQIDYYIVAEDGVGLTSSSPEGAPDDFYTLYVTEELYAYEMEDPEDPDWQMGVAGDDATTGHWIRDDPVGTEYFGLIVQPDDDHTPAPGYKCFVTGNAAPGDPAGTNDVDGGCTTLVSPTFDLSTAERAFVKYVRWYGEGGLSVDDDWVVEVSNDDGDSWYELERETDNANWWTWVSKDLNAVLPELTDQVVFRFLACDQNSGGLVEAAVDDFSIQSFTESVVAVEGEDDAATPVRHVFGLAQNHPNPFNPLTTISFSLPRSGQVELAIYAIDGRKVASLVNEPMAAGSHTVTWDGSDNRGQRVASGTYFYRLQADDEVATKRMVLVK